MEEQAFRTTIRYVLVACGCLIMAGLLGTRLYQDLTQVSRLMPEDDDCYAASISVIARLARYWVKLWLVRSLTNPSDRAAPALRISLSG